jgi:hypothetical protein
MEIQKKTELRIKIPQWISDLLKEHCKLYGVSPVSTIVPLLVEYLRHSSRARDNSTNCINNIYSKNISTKTLELSESEKEKGTQIPDDFDPPREITQELGIDHKSAVALFTAYAKSKSVEYVDWDAAFRSNCYSWIKDKIQKTQKQHTTKSVDHIPEYEDEEEF